MTDTIYTNTEILFDTEQVASVYAGIIHWVKMCLPAQVIDWPIVALSYTSFAIGSLQWKGIQVTWGKRSRYCSQVSVHFAGRMLIHGSCPPLRSVKTTGLRIVQTRSGLNCSSAILVPGMKLAGVVAEDIVISSPVCFPEYFWGLHWTGLKE